MTLRTAMQKKGKVLGELEEQILERLWVLNGGTVRQVLEALPRSRQAAYTTVMTVMARMVLKGYLARRELGNGSFLYTPRQRREEFYAMTSKALFSQLIRNFGPLAVAQFVDALEEVDPEQIRALRERLAHIK